MRKLLLIPLLLLLTACPALQDTAGDVVEQTVATIGRGDDQAELMASATQVVFIPAGLALDVVLTVVGDVVTVNTPQCTQEAADAASCLVGDVDAPLTLDVACSGSCVLFVSFYREGNPIPKTFYGRY